VLSDLLEAERHHAESALIEAAERAQAAGVPVTTRLATGDPAERICAYARELDALLVVMGTHGYGAVMSLLLGSVSSTVVRRAGCPVVVVPLPSPDGAAAAVTEPAQAAAEEPIETEQR
jgi:nucleotide-binding universal stress UspA family protein